LPRGVRKMRRTTLLAVAVLAVVALPVIGIGQTTTSHGGSPSDVFVTQPDSCHGEDPVRRRPVVMAPTPIDVSQPSHVLAYFTSTISTRSREAPAASLWLRITGMGLVETSEQWIQRLDKGHSTVTVMWTFDAIATGEYTVHARARLPALPQDQQGMNLQACALTVLVTPVE
jgi:hypothetical protein